MCVCFQGPQIIHVPAVKPHTLGWVENAAHVIASCPSELLGVYKAHAGHQAGACLTLTVHHESRNVPVLMISRSEPQGVLANC